MTEIRTSTACSCIGCDTIRLGVDGKRPPLQKQKHSRTQFVFMLWQAFFLCLISPARAELTLYRTLSYWHLKRNGMPPLEALAIMAKARWSSDGAN